MSHPYGTPPPPQPRYNGQTISPPPAPSQLSPQLQHLQLNPNHSVIMSAPASLSVGPPPGVTKLSNTYVSYPPGQATPNLQYLNSNSQFYSNHVQGPPPTAKKAATVPQTTNAGPSSASPFSTGSTQYLKVEERAKQAFWRLQENKTPARELWQLVQPLVTRTNDVTDFFTGLQSSTFDQSTKSVTNRGLGLIDSCNFNITAKAFVTIEQHMKITNTSSEVVTLSFPQGSSVFLTDRNIFITVSASATTLAVAEAADITVSISMLQNIRVDNYIVCWFALTGQSGNRSFAGALIKYQLDPTSTDTAWAIDPSKITQITALDASVSIGTFCGTRVLMKKFALTEPSTLVEADQKWSSDARLINHKDRIFVPILGTLTTATEKYNVYYTGSNVSTLFEHLQNLTDISSEGHRWIYKFAIALAEILAIVSTAGIGHLDLNSSNILVVTDNTGALLPRIIGWGAAIDFTKPPTPLPKQPGDPSIRSFHAHNTLMYNRSCDVFSFAAIVAEMLHRNRQVRTDQQLVSGKLNLDFSDAVKFGHQTLIDVINALIDNSNPQWSNVIQLLKAHGTNPGASHPTSSFMP